MFLSKALSAFSGTGGAAVDSLAACTKKIRNLILSALKKNFYIFHQKRRDSKKDFFSPHQTFPQSMYVDFYDDSGIEETEYHDIPGLVTSSKTASQQDCWSFHNIIIFRARSPSSPPIKRRPQHLLLWLDAMQTDLVVVPCRSQVCSCRDIVSQAFWPFITLKH